MNHTPPANYIYVFAAMGKRVPVYSDSPMPLEEVARIAIPQYKEFGKIVEITELSEHSDPSDPHYFETVSLLKRLGFMKGETE